MQGTIIENRIQHQARLLHLWYDAMLCVAELDSHFTITCCQLTSLVIQTDSGADQLIRLLRLVSTTYTAAGLLQSVNYPRQPGVCAWGHCDNPEMEHLHTFGNRDNYRLRWCQVMVSTYVQKPQSRKRGSFHSVSHSLQCAAFRFMH